MNLLFLADQFASDHRDAMSAYPGGAELTDAAALAACPWPIDTMKVEDIDHGRFSDYDAIIVSNLDRASKEQRRELTRLSRHILFEHDYRQCRVRGNLAGLSRLARFQHERADHCTCKQSVWNDVFASAVGAIFLTQRQLERYRTTPGLNLPNCRVLGSSIMGKVFFEVLRSYQLSRTAAEGTQGPPVRSGSAIVYSAHANKGFAQAEEYCRAHELTPTIIKNLRPHEVWSTLQAAERLVYLPQWMEPAGRLPVEARFLGCQLVLNENLGVTHESWWRAPDPIAQAFVEDAGPRFWRIVEDAIKGRAAHSNLGTRLSPM